ncbi:chemotaxis protein CheC [Proteinivorax hydrogeniformans]|uniref:Chemotaxis protein CheC n=1 Tax=Proteinivorax hydrogeniformans TaxID=1826727 RepID=A0AAU8HPK7_9FIRM
MFNKSIKPLQKDLLKELGNIGAGNAATAFSTLISNRVELNVPEVELVGFENSLEFVGDEAVAAMYFRVNGSLPGNMLLMLPLETVDFILQSVGKNKTASWDDLDSYNQSMLMEIGNILCGAYISAISDFTQKKMVPTVPAFAIDMAGAIINIPLAQLGDMSEKALLIKTTFNRDGKDFSGNFLFIPEPSALTELMNHFGVVQ